MELMALGISSKLLSESGGLMSVKFSLPVISMNVITVCGSTLFC